MSQEPLQPNQDTRPNFPKMEEEIAEFWKKKRIFERSLEERPENKAFVFYDGPPFATGTPHYGHILQSAIKDAIPRYATMQGYRVSRRWGWDCHGLPVENLIEKSLKLNSKRDIESYGIDKFNDACRASVMTYASEWKKYVDRLGRWVDFDGAYRTMDASFTESVWWAFAELWKNKLIYEDLRVSLYCPRCSTPLSNFEIAMGNHFVDAQDPAITVKFPVKGEERTFLLAWTTTPWSLPGDMALAVHPEQMYIKVKLHDTNEILIFAEAAKASVLKQYFPLVPGAEVPFEIIAQVKGSDLVGLTYEPPYLLSEEVRMQLTMREGKMMYRVVPMDYVTVEDGTGIVHTAPGFGEEDFQASKLHDLPVVATVDDEGRQKPEVPIAPGVPVKESDAMIREDLRSRGLLYQDEVITHSVPICWRCSTKLLYKAQPAWFVDVTKLKPKLLDTAKKINWHPEHFKQGRFGKGLETAPDWCISRTRYWGAPLPVWKCDACTERRVIGSLKELQDASGAPLPVVEGQVDVHRPGIDRITLPCSCGGMMRRIPEVFDCWVESGSMSFAAEHYPFERKEWFDQHFPANFISEGQDQTRGWFYSLHVLATALFGKPAFQHCNVTGMIMAEDGKKMSKSLKNYPDPWELMTRLGADTLRMYLLSSPVVQAEQLNFSEKDCETLQRTLFGTLWNVRAFYLLYAAGETVEFVKPRSAHMLDRWLMSRLMSVIREMIEALNRYDLVAATRPLRAWVDDVSTWWLRRSRERMKGTNAYEKMDALRTLREVLQHTALIFAPFTPFFAERLYQDMDGSKMSVHLDHWPKVDERLIDEQLLVDMQWVRDVATAGHEARALAKMPVRQALASLTVRMRDAHEAARLSQRAELLLILRDELNVERVSIQGGAETESVPWNVVLDTVLTPELKKRGLLRELSRRIMNVRKQLGLSPQDTIQVTLSAVDPGLRETLESMVATLLLDVKARSIDVTDAWDESATGQEVLDVEGAEVRIGVRL